MLMKLESHPKYNEGVVIDRKEIHEPRMPFNCIQLSFRSNDYMMLKCVLLFSQIHSEDISDYF